MEKKAALRVLLDMPAATRCFEHDPPSPVTSIACRLWPAQSSELTETSRRLNNVTKRSRQDCSTRTCRLSWWPGVSNLDSRLVNIARRLCVVDQAKMIDRRGPDSPSTISSLFWSYTIIASRVPPAFPQACIASNKRTESP